MFFEHENGPMSVEVDYNKFLKGKNITKVP